jgi:hypothetical protein
VEGHVAEWRDEIDEVGSIAAELANAYQERVAYLREHMQLDNEQAKIVALGLDRTPDEVAALRERLLREPPEEVEWLDLQCLAEHDPDALVEIWEKLKSGARDELVSGHRAAQMMDWQRRPWARAQYLAIREDFRDGMPPQSGIEAALIDLAAEAYGDYLELSQLHHRLLATEAEVERGDIKRKGRWRPPHQIIADAEERTTRSVDRAHQRFLKTVKMLHEIQRSAPTLYVNHAGQINVGQQQVNVAESAVRGGPTREDLPK